MVDNMNRRFIAALAITALTASCSGSDTTTTLATPATTEPPQQATTTAVEETSPAIDLDAIVTEFVGSAEGGAAVLIVRNGEASTAAAGSADSAGKTLTAEMPFRVGSISKPFVATIILQMVDEGRISLDDELGAHLPETPLGADTTIRDLLSHVSGIANYTDQPAFFEDVLQ